MNKKQNRIGIRWKLTASLMFLNVLVAFGGVNHNKDVSSVAGVQVS